MSEARWFDVVGPGPADRLLINSRSSPLGEHALAVEDSAGRFPQPARVRPDRGARVVEPFQPSRENAGAVQKGEDER